MDDRQVGEYWNENARGWVPLARAGCDVLRDRVNTPAFLGMLPAVEGLDGLDVGCGEGHNTRLLARRGARMTALDIAPRFLAAARAAEAEAPLGIRFLRATGSRLPLADASFDFVTAFMSLMDMPDQGGALRECRRVLRPGGFLQFSICHPCFSTPRWRWILDASGRRVAMECGDYFRPLDGDLETWMFSAAPPEAKAEFGQFRVPRFNRILSDWLNLLIDSGFALERFAEPTAGPEVLEACPQLYDSTVIAYALIVRGRAIDPCRA
jgi:SAM-dependent methyltransferase